MPRIARRSVPVPLVLALLACAAAAAGEAAQGKPGEAAPKPSRKAARPAAGPMQGTLDVHEFVLDNGMRFLVLPRPAAPVFSGVISFKVGGVDERPGITGTAHLFEHMAFKGTPVIGTRDYAAESEVMDRIAVVGRQLSEEAGKGPASDPARIDSLRQQLGKLSEEQRKVLVKDELDQIYSRNGAQMLNAGTGNDFTTYLVSLPKNRLELWFLLESARLRWPVLREFYTERDVVAEERRFRVETQPGGALWETLLLTAFAAHPYRYPIVGWMSDLDTLTLEQAREFYESHYSPHNAVAALVGDLDPEEVEALARRYFGPIPRRGDPPPVTTREPRQLGERRAAVEFDAEPDLLLAWHKPTIPAKDDVVFHVIDSLMTGGRTSRLYKTLVKEGRLAVSVDSSAEIPGVRYDNLWMLSATPRSPHTCEEVEAAVEREVGRLTSEPVEPRELQKILNQLEASLVRRLRSNLGMAMQLATWQLLAGDWRVVQELPAKYRAVTAEDVQRVARTWLVPENRTVVTIVPKRPPAEAPAPEGGDIR